LRRFGITFVISNSVRLTWLRVQLVDEGDCCLARALPSSCQTAGKGVPAGTMVMVSSTDFLRASERATAIATLNRQRPARTIADELDNPDPELENKICHKQTSASREQQQLNEIRAERLRKSDQPTIRALSRQRIPPVGRIVADDSARPAYRGTAVRDLPPGRSRRRRQAPWLGPQSPSHVG
jgi:hypothetical protein